MTTRRERNFQNTIKGYLSDHFAEGLNVIESTLKELKVNSYHHSPTRRNHLGKRIRGQVVTTNVGLLCKHIRFDGDNDVEMAEQPQQQQQEMEQPQQQEQPPQEHQQPEQPPQQPQQQPPQHLSHPEREVIITQRRYERCATQQMVDRWNVRVNRIADGFQTQSAFQLFQPIIDGHINNIPQCFRFLTVTASRLQEDKVIYTFYKNLLAWYEYQVYDKLEVLRDPAEVYQYMIANGSDETNFMDRQRLGRLADKYRREFGFGVFVAQELFPACVFTSHATAERYIQFLRTVDLAFFLRRLDVDPLHPLYENLINNWHHILLNKKLCLIVSYIPPDIEGSYMHKKLFRIGW